MSRPGRTSARPGRPRAVPAPSSANAPAARAARGGRSGPSARGSRRGRIDAAIWAGLIVVVIATVSVLSPSLHSQYLNYDDDLYVTQNPYVQQLTPDHLHTLFTTRYQNQYAPVAMLLMGLEFRLFHGDAVALRWVAILVHVANTLLLFALVRRLFGRPWLALVTAALFAVHPLQVESVAWITAHMKIGWYVLFTLVSLLAYARYASSGGIGFYAASLIVFILAALSKEQAVALVAMLPVTDYVLKRDLRAPRVWIEKLPFVALAVAIGAVTLGAASSQQGADQLGAFGFPQRAILASYAFASYLAKLLMPVRLSAFYTYPIRIPAHYMAAPLAIVAVLAALGLAWRRDERLVVFGIMLFLTQVALTLANQLFSLRDVLMADRYVYLASAGAFLILAYGLERLGRRQPSLQPVLGVVLVAYVVGLAAAAYSRTRVWHDSITLFSDVIAKNVAEYGRATPLLSLAYNNRGVARKNQGDIAGGLSDFDDAARVNPRDPRSFVNRGNIYFNRQDFDHALPDYDRAIALDATNSTAYSNRGALYANRGQFDRALSDLDQALALQPEFLDALRSRALVYQAMGRHEQAIADCTRYLGLAPNADLYNVRAVSNQALKRTTEAEADFTQAIRLDSHNAGFLRNRSLLYASVGDSTRAFRDAQAAQALQSNPSR